jgi:dTDP-4-amino-4,6-dideoxygalactose transaminase
MTIPTKHNAVPYLRLQPEFNALQQEWMAAIAATGANGSFILGPNVRQFEAEAAAYLGSRFGISVANGTDALELSLKALGIGPGDQVITSPFTFFATAEAITKVGAVPVFADIDPNSLNLDPQDVRKRMTAEVKAILPVHIFGNPADMDSLAGIAMEHGIRLLEDCAQAFGASHNHRKVGSIGATGCFSFYPTKVLGCYGDGGFISTDSEHIRDHLLKLRNHGATAPFTHDEPGYNSRLDEIQAALLRIKLRKIEDDIAARIRIAEKYRSLLCQSDAILPESPPNGRHVYNLYSIRHPRRDALKHVLSEQGIGYSQCYPLGLHLQAVYRALGYQPGDLPVTDQVCKESISLPIFPDLGEDEIQRVCHAVLSV